MILPDYRVRVKTIPASKLPKWAFDIAAREFERCSDASGWNPKTVHLMGDLYIVNTCGKSEWKYGGGLASVDVALVRDHAFLSKIPNAPKSVKNIYRKSVRLKHLRATDAWDELAATDKAIADWCRCKGDAK